MQIIQDRNSEKQCQDKEGDKTEEPRGSTSIEAFSWDGMGTTTLDE